MDRAELPDEELRGARGLELLAVVKRSIGSRYVTGSLPQGPGRGRRMIDGRRKYRNEAHKQRAYRARNQERLRQEREEAAELVRLGGELVTAVRSAAAAGDSLAIAVQAATSIEVVRQLIDHFQADQPPGEAVSCHQAELPARHET